MQVGGVGSGHDTYSHQVTGCIHEHGENKDVGGAGTKLGSVQTIQTAEEVLQENSSVNLMSWVQNISSKGKQLLQKPCRRILRETCCPGYRILGIVENSSYRRSGETAKNPMMR